MQIYKRSPTKDQLVEVAVKKQYTYYWKPSHYLFQKIIWAAGTSTPIFKPHGKPLLADKIHGSFIYQGLLQYLGLYLQNEIQIKSL